jgi:hypothetical protein
MMRLYVLIIAIGCSAALQAQENPKAEIFGAVSVFDLHTAKSSSGDALMGGHFGAAVLVRPHLMLVGDFSAHKRDGYWGHEPGVHFCVENCQPIDHYIPGANARTFLFGPRVRADIDRNNAVFAHALVGVFRQGSETASANGSAFGLGGGFDRRLFGAIAGRLQLDWTPGRIQGHWEKNVRAGLGLLWRIGS